MNEYLKLGKDLDFYENCFISFLIVCQKLLAWGQKGYVIIKVKQTVNFPFLVLCFLVYK